MESTISTKDLKAKLDRKQGITVVETLAPEQWRERISRQPPKNTYLKD